MANAGRGKGSVNLGAQMLNAGRAGSVSASSYVANQDVYFPVLRNGVTICPEPLAWAKPLVVLDEVGGSYEWRYQFEHSICWQRVGQPAQVVSQRQTFGWPNWSFWEDTAVCLGEWGWSPVDV